MFGKLQLAEVLVLQVDDGVRQQVWRVCKKRVAHRVAGVPADDDGGSGPRARGC